MLALEQVITAVPQPADCKQAVPLTSSIVCKIRRDNTSADAATAAHIRVVGQEWRNTHSKHLESGKILFRNHGDGIEPSRSDRSSTGSGTA